jgi:hypothetical protein
MDQLDKLGTGEKIAAGSAILLFVFMFFDWFGVEVSGVPGFSGTVPGSGGSAWDKLDFIPIVLLVAVLAALVMVGLRLADSVGEPVVPLSAAVTVLGVISVLLILYRIIDPPGGGSYGGVSVDTNLQVGIFLGLLSAAGIAYGGYSTMREEGITFGDAADSLSRGSRSAPPQSPSSQTPPPPPAPSSGSSQAPPPPPPPPPGN